jgi:1,4-dihydroxy-2-naphthoate octaprenyltransferase
LSKIKAWFSAARLRTLPLSISGIVVGTAIANHLGYFDLTIFLLALFATVGFQVTSNFANDYGDGVKGTDNKDRIGPKRTFQSGLLTREELKKGVIYSIIFDFLVVGWLLYESFAGHPIGYLLLFLALALASAWAAINYTVGTRAYGYRGWGDLFVFCFFGLVGVLGSMFLFTKFITMDAILPAISIGLLSTAVLNLNNMRDLESDKKAQKFTMVVKMGLAGGKIYHYSLILLAFAAMLGYVSYKFNNWLNILCLFAFVPVFFHLHTVRNISNPADFDPELRKLALSTFLLAVLFYIGYNYFL